MNLDQYGLPMQADGDVMDQLQRVGMIATGYTINNTNGPLEGPWLTLLHTELCDRLQPKPGVYVRHVNGNANNVSADQLIPVLAYWICSRNWSQALLMLFRMVTRLGFAQNYKDGLDDSKQDYKFPDFMLLRSASLFARTHWSLYPLAILADLHLPIASLAAVGPVWKDGKGFAKRTPDDVDDNNLVVTLAVCRAVMPTPLSWLACKLYAKYRPWNYGCYGVGDEYGNADPEAYSPVYGALRWYHRTENGGNIEVAELWKPIIERYFR